MTQIFAIAPEGRSRDELERNLVAVAAAGARGVVAGDHLFLTPGSRRHREPLTLLAAIGALASELTIGSYVANVWLRHPGQLLRELAQLACLYDGRVIAGLGAGWHAAEYAAFGRPMPPHERRLRRLAQTAAAADAAFDGGTVTMKGEDFALERFRLSPLPATRPSILIGGGSAAACRIAARHADVVDLNAVAKASERSGGTVLGDLQRRLLTRVEDLEALVELTRAEAAAAGRPTPRFSTFVHAVVTCNGGGVEEAEERLCAAAGLPRLPLDQCPFVLVGDAGRIRAELAERIARLDLDIVVVPGDPETIGLVAAAVRSSRAQCV
jgi:alkanesulfonate monooxygenase SsuD/methylene tetrahydromethanopterin reductase-like flavin-dependent oxidoreductase (luciferase family)